MLITKAELEQFSGTILEDGETQESITNTIIMAATEIINHYLGFNVEGTTADNIFYDEESETLSIPQDVKFVCYEISSLIQMEQGGNIGINNKSFDAGGSRSFLNVVDFSKYLCKLSCYRKAFL